MARWKLTEPHYLKVDGTMWEYVEIERVTGRPKRVQFPVPRYIDPRDPKDWTIRRSPDDGDIVLCNGEGVQTGDLIYKGEPTPGMFPLDKEAEEISSRYKWTPTQGLDEASQAESNTQRLLNGLIEQISEAQAGLNQQPRGGEMTELLSAMTAMMKQNQEILTKLVERPAIRSLR